MDVTKLYMETVKKMSNMEFLDPQGAKRFQKQKLVQFCQTPYE